MGTYKDLINCVKKLSSGIKIVVTVEFCNQHNISVDSSTIKTWGKRFAKDYSTCGVVYIDKGSNNLRIYKKL